MIRSFRHKGLAELFRDGGTGKVHQGYHARCLRMLDVLNRAVKLEDVNLPGYRLHQLNTKTIRHAISVSGPWRITFQWLAEDGDAAKVDLEQYH